MSKAQSAHLYGADVTQYQLSRAKDSLETILEGVLDHLAVGIVVADPGLSVHYANRAALRLLTQEAPLRIEDGVLVSPLLGLLEKIKVLMQALNEGSAGMAMQNVLSLPRGNGASALELLTAPISDTDMLSQQPIRLFTLFVLDPTQGLDRAELTLCALYELTPTEGKVAVLLSRGYRIAEVARTLSIGMPTVRTHCQNLYRKTCTGSQGELIRRLASGVASVVTHH